MLFFLIVFVITVSSLIIHKWVDEEVSTPMQVIVGICLFFIITVGGMSHSSHTNKIEEYLSFKDRLEYYHEIHPYRSQLSEGEIEQIIKYNRWIERGQIDNKSLWFGWFIPNRFENLKKIDIGGLL